MFFKFLWVFCFNKKNKGLDIKEHKQQNSKYTPTEKLVKAEKNRNRQRGIFDFPNFPTTAIATSTELVNVYKQTNTVPIYIYVLLQSIR